ncbi:MAG: hypothetical protein LC640_04935, partial [Frankia sp.]|nr:hypothetical protein [Frankia sp.]
MPDVDERDAATSAALTFVLAGAGFLALGALLHAITAAQRIAPGLLTLNDATSVGRLIPAAETLAVYGGLGMLATGVALELARALAGGRAALDLIARAGGALVTLGVGVGTLVLLLGHTTGRAGLELPRPFAVAIAVGLALAAVAVLRTVAVQPDDEVHPALWFVGAGVASGPA